MANKIYTYKGYSFRKGNTPSRIYVTNVHDYSREYIGDVYYYDVKKDDAKNWKPTMADTVEGAKSYINNLIRKEEDRKRRAEFKKELKRSFGELY